jgi:hypothetical protein
LNLHGFPHWIPSELVGIECDLLLYDLTSTYEAGTTSDFAAAARSIALDFQMLYLTFYANFRLDQ